MNSETKIGGSDHDPEERALVARVASPLKADVKLDDSFEERLGAALRARAPRGATALRPNRREFWTRPVTLSRLSTLALAAGVAFVSALATLAVTNNADSSAPVGAAPSVQLVRFVYVDSTAHSVALVGDFNGWSRSATDLEQGSGPGVWSISIPLTPGRHEYAFVVDGKRWVVDPFANVVHDDFGTESSVIDLDASSPSAT